METKTGIQLYMKSNPYSQGILFFEHFFSIISLTVFHLKGQKVKKYLDVEKITSHLKEHLTEQKKKKEILFLNSRYYY